MRFRCSQFPQLISRLAWLVLSLFVFLPGDSFALSSLKVGVYNIHGGVGSDGNTDLSRIGRVLKSAAPEVIGLNEVNRFWVGDDHDQVLADELGPQWNAYFGKTLDKWWNASDYGNAIITRLPVVSSQSWLLSEYPDQERRGLMRVTVQKDGETIHIFNTHMGLDATMRAIHADEILSIMNTFPGHKILLGDFNEQRTGTSIEKFAAQLTDCWQQFGMGSASTFSATNPTRRIDFIWLSPTLAASSCYVPMFPDARVASDHLAVFANVLTPDAVQPVVNDISIRVNGQERLTAPDTVAPNPDEYTRGSIALVTSGDTTGNPPDPNPTQIIADNLAFSRLVDLYSQDFNSAPLGGAPADWNFLYATADTTYDGRTVELGGHRFWRQRSDSYLKYHYAPATYPDWKNYEVSARVKTVSTGGGVWRLLAYNYPATDTAYETYKIEVRHVSGALPQLRIMKGGTQLAAATLFDYDVDPYDWNVYALQVAEDSKSLSQVTRRLIAYVDGKRVATAVDVIPGTPDPDGYSQGSVALTTVGGALGQCEIYVDDISVRQWQPGFTENFDGSVSAHWQHLYTTPNASATTGIVTGRNGNGWGQSSDNYTKYHYAPTPYPAWQNIAFQADVKTARFGTGKWRMNGYNYPSEDTAYETYKLEVHAGNGNPLLRLMKGGSTVKETPFSALGIDPAAWQSYELNIHTFQPDGRIINKNPPSAIEGWPDF